MVEYSEHNEEIKKCYEKVLNSTVQLFEYDEAPHGIGSGVLVKICSNYFLFTVAHILENFEGENQITARINENLFIPFEGQVCYSIEDSASKLDFGYLKLSLSTSTIVKEYFNFLDSSNIALNFYPKTGLTLNAAGYPNAFTKKGGIGINSKGVFQQLAHSKNKVYEFYNYSKNTHYIVDYKYKDPKTGKYKKLEEPYGNSGGGLWVIQNKQSEKGNFPDIYLIGLLSTVKKYKYYVLIAERLENIIDAIYLNYREKFDISDGRHLKST